MEVVYDVVLMNRSMSYRMAEMGCVLSVRITNDLHHHAP